MTGKLSLQTNVEPAIKWPCINLHIKKGRACFFFGILRKAGIELYGWWKMTCISDPPTISSQVLGVFNNNFFWLG